MFVRVSIAVAAVVAALTLPTTTAVAASSGGVPYADPAQVGVIGLCDRSDHEITHGSIDAIPFVAKAVSSVRAPAPYDGAGRSAFLLAYQPRHGLEPAEWSGEYLTAASEYSNADHPMAEGDKGDISLAQFVSDYPPGWDGLVQLRIYYKATGQPTYSYRYAATDLRVSGNRWQVVRGGSVPCTSGHAVSMASIIAPQAAAGKVHLVSPEHASAASGHGQTGSARRTTVSATPLSPTVDTAARRDSAGNGSSSHAGLGVGLVALVAAAAGGGYLVRRRVVAGT